MIIELGLFFLVPAVDEQGALWIGGAVEHSSAPGCSSSSRDPQARRRRSSVMKNRGRRGQGQGRQGPPPQGAPAPAPDGFSPF